MTSPRYRTFDENFISVSKTCLLLEHFPQHNISGFCWQSVIVMPPASIQRQQMLSPLQWVVRLAVVELSVHRNGCIRGTAYLVYAHTCVLIVLTTCLYFAHCSETFMSSQTLTPKSSCFYNCTWHSIFHHLILVHILLSFFHTISPVW
jgi:hypothetical protein